MTTEFKELVKATIPILKENGVLLTKHFYERMFTYNPELKHVFNMGNQKNEKQQTALAMAVLAYAEHIEDPSVLLPVVNHIGHKHTSLDIRPEHYAIVGKHLIASIKEVLGDAATPKLLEAWTIAYNQLATLMSSHEQTIYNDQINKDGGWAGWRPFVIKEKIKESEEITSFYLYPSDGGNVADFKPGQFISLRLFLPELNLLQPRQYSISCAPNGIYYRISVKRETANAHPDGLISNRLHDHMKIGDLIDLSAPSGVFTLQDQKNKTKVFISGGVGQTPLMSMMESLISEEKLIQETQIKWIHGCRNERVHAFKNRLEELKNKYINIKQHIFYDTVESQNDILYEGWVDLSQINDNILSENTEYYICGPSGFINKHYKYLIENNISKEKIHFEEFGPSTLNV